MSGLEDPLEDTLGGISNPPVLPVGGFVVGELEGDGNLGLQGKDRLGVLRAHRGTVSRRML